MVIKDSGGKVLIKDNDPGYIGRTHARNGWGCYLFYQIALTENKNFLLDFKRLSGRRSGCDYGTRLLSLETVPSDGIIQVFGITNTYIDYPKNWFSILVKPTVEKIFLTMSGTNGIFQKMSFGLKEPKILAQLESNNWQTSLASKNSKKDINTRDTPIQSSRPKPPSSATQSPKAQTPIPQLVQPSKPINRLYSGTGFMFGSKDYVITNWHVIRGTKNIKVKFLNGERINAEILLKDSQNDIAFLKLERSPQLPTSSLRVGDSSKVRMGDKVFTIGYPAHWVMGQNPKYTEGVVNALSGIKDDPTVFQISVQIQPGNSGGPLFNQSGNVIGITQAALDPQLAAESIGALPQNVNYAIKSTYIKKLFPMLPETLVINRGIVIVPTEPKNSLAAFIDKAKNNIVLIEASISKLPLPQTGKQNFSSDSLRGPVKKYIESIKRKIITRYPLSARQKGLEGQVTVQFHVLRTGKYINLKVSKTSNNIFNKASLEAVQQAAPFPGFPKDIDEEFLVIKLPIKYHLIR